MAVLLSVVLLLRFGTALGTDTNHFDPGFCTWDAAQQAYQEWGIFPPWYGDAGDWIQDAQDFGWHVTSTPETPAIMVLPRGIQGSGPLGHVAWTLGIEDDGTTVDVRSMNWHGRGVITLHQLQADGNAQFLTPTDPEKAMTGPR